MTPGSVRRVAVRLLPWRPRWRSQREHSWDLPDLGVFDGDDSVSLAIGFIALLLFAPFVVLFVVGVVLLSAELLLVLALLPFAMLGQVVGVLPWVLAVTDSDGLKHAVPVKGTRAMLTARRYYRSLRP